MDVLYIIEDLNFLFRIDRNLADEDYEPSLKCSATFFISS